MKISVSSALALLLAPAVLANALPRCSDKSSLPCRCPSGTAYEQSVTFATIGAAAADFKAVTADFFDTAWLGVSPFATRGPNNTPGKSIRSAHLPTAVGTYDVSEILFDFKTRPDGSFTQVFGLLPSTLPIKYQSGNGSFGGYWITLQSEYVFPYETAVRWSVYACSTGHPQNYAGFHEFALNNATSVLQSQGKIKGMNLKPISIQDF